MRLGVMAALSMIVGVSSAADTGVETAFVHGRIHTQDPHRTVADAMVLRGNTIIAVGTDAAIEALRGPQTQTVDLRGHVVLPGIIDAHTHPADSSRELGKCTLHDEVLPPAAIKTHIRACLKTNPGRTGQWFEVVQVNPTRLSLTLKDLDSILATRPMFLNGTDGHTVWANSAALRAQHIDNTTVDPVGGRIVRDARGALTGTFRDSARDVFVSAVPNPDPADEAIQLNNAFNSMRAIGITSVQDASVDEHLMRIYKRLYDDHQLNMRVRASFRLSNLHRPAKTLIDEAIAFRARWAVDPEFLRADAVKIFADGVIEYPSQSAALLKPYLDATGRPTQNLGPAYFEQSELNQLVAAADSADFTVHVHAIGDAAVRAALDAFAFSRLQNGTRDNRDQIAHLELVDPADFPRFKELGVIANFQLLWAVRDDYVVTGTLPFIGSERALHLYPARSLRDAGALIVGGSDWSVSSFNAFEAMERAITRSAGPGKPPLFPEQGISLEDAIDSYTINSAYALKQERTTGSLEIGKRGDFIVLDRDIFAETADQLHATRVLATYLDGREVYAAQTLPLGFPAAVTRSGNRQR